MSKILLETVVEGKKFEKPLFQTFLMFGGMLLALPMHFVIERIQAREQVDGDYVQLVEEPSPRPPSKVQLVNSRENVM